ncbi:3-alpha domain-containing protein [Agrobacterium rosae]|uniref:3-alpha domain-containing protein n=1 Tax=Agrobacterium rosae TaxID=1972867 RepID=UPI0011B83ECB|nr:hypothetical protein DXM21_13005 [Agrobacterium rosae]KAA3520124.1 hypothetical protein DXM25_10610 [Agrobacterium rosae]MCM2431895.1 hypothetical protein [Agrobacterium rosae]MQB49058.1 hypothetical protein [Agrobacterium rosae]
MHRQVSFSQALAWDRPLHPAGLLRAAQVPALPPAWVSEQPRRQHQQARARQQPVFPPAPQSVPWAAARTLVRFQWDPETVGPQAAEALPVYPVSSVPDHPLPAGQVHRVRPSALDRDEWPHSASAMAQVVVEVPPWAFLPQAAVAVALAPFSLPAFSLRVLVAAPLWVALPFPR